MDRYRVERIYLTDKRRRRYVRYRVVDYKTGADITPKPVTRPTAYATASALNYPIPARTRSTEAK